MILGLYVDILAGKFGLRIECIGSAENHRQKPSNGPIEETRRPLDSSTTRRGSFDEILPFRGVVDIDLEISGLIEPVYQPERQVEIRHSVQAKTIYIRASALELNPGLNLQSLSTVVDSRQWLALDSCQVLAGSLLYAVARLVDDGTTVRDIKLAQMNLSHEDERWGRDRGLGEPIVCHGWEAVRALARSRISHEAVRVADSYKYFFMGKVAIFSTEDEN